VGQSVGALARELEWLREFTPATRRAALLPPLGGERETRERTRRLGAPGTGIDRIRYLGLAYPVFNWDDIPTKQGLHNRHLVGLVAADTFLYVPGLSLYGRTVLVVGYGPVGRGVADAARSFGATVEVCDVDPAARLAAAHLGFPTPTLEAGLQRADAILPPPAATASCRSKFSPAARAAFLANLGHTSGELPIEELRQHVLDNPRPHVERCRVGGKTLYLLVGGAMFNLAAGPGTRSTPSTS
jgi:adenosylhomocysteinase